MEFIIENTSDKQEFIAEIGMQVRAKSLSRPLTQAEYNAVCASPTGYAWARIVPVLAEGEKKVAKTKKPLAPDKKQAETGKKP